MQPQTRTLTLDGIDFVVSLEGPEAAPVLMLSNSLSSNMAMWAAQMPAFTRRFRVLRYDQRGHGRTGLSPRPFSIDDLADDAVRILDALHIREAHFCGVSMGGMTGMSLLRRHSGRIGRAVLANTSAKMGPPDLWNQRIRAVRAGGMASVVDATVARWLTPAFRDATPDAVQAIRDMILTTPADGYAACCAAIRDMDQREALRGVREKAVLVIIGAHDPATTPYQGEIVAAAIPNAKRLVLEGAHLTNIELPAAFAQAVIDHLEGID